MKRVFTALTVTVLLFSTTIISAETLPFRVTNETGYPLFAVFISHVSEESWGKDFLGTDVLMPGERKVFYVDNSGYNSTIYDVQFIDSDGDTYTFYGCIRENSSVTLRLRDMD